MIVDVRLTSLVILAALAAAPGCSREPAGQKPVDQPPPGDPARGVAALEKYSCGSCHVIPGVREATGTVAPSLEGIASRPQLAGNLPNTPENLRRWIQRPQEVAEGTDMPDMGVTDQDALDIAAHLSTLKSTAK